MVVDPDAIVDPRAVAVGLLVHIHEHTARGHLLIMLGHAALAPAAMLAPERCPDHTSHAEMRLVVLPLADQVVDNGLLLGDPVEFGYETRVVYHGPRVEEASE